MKIKPLFDRVIALPIKEEQQTKSGICLDFVENGSVKKAIVIAIGNGIYEEGRFEEMQVKIGDIIYFEEHTVAKINIDNELHILIKQTDILAVENKA